MIDWLVALVDHWYVSAIVDVNVIVCPWQKVVAPLTDIMGVCGLGFTIIVSCLEVLEQPVSPSKTVTEYIPDVFIVILSVVAPLDHKYNPCIDEDSITESPMQKLAGPLETIIGGIVVQGVTFVI